MIHLTQGHMSLARQLFEVRSLAPTATRIDPDVNVLVLVHPKNLPPATQFAIDQFALRGGHILLFVDPLSENDVSGADSQNPMAAMVADKSSHLEALLSAWGVQFDPGKVVADRGRALSVTMREGEEPVEHLGVLGLDQSSISDDVITAGLSNINMAMAGALALIKGSQVRFEPLLQSSADAALLPAARFRLLMDPASLLDGLPSGQRYTLAARHRPIRTAFPDDRPRGSAAGSWTEVSSPNRPLNLIVFADRTCSDRGDAELLGSSLPTWASNGDGAERARQPRRQLDPRSACGRAAPRAPSRRVRQHGQ
jgi:ABC-type uncharacterized transport system involved in gliding motility auxiliary subunit